MEKITLFVFGILATTFLPEAQTTIIDSTEVSGTWTIANSPYNINGLATIPPGSLGSATIGFSILK